MALEYKTFYWLLKRECWEHRWLIWGPWVLAAIFVAINALLVGLALYSSNGDMHIRLSDGSSLGALSSSLDTLEPRDVVDIGRALSLVLYSGLGVFAITLGVMVFFYALHALYDERRDRSILFWKSLPVSDAQTVLSKIVLVVLLLPLWTLSVGVIAAWLAVGVYLGALAGMNAPIGDVLTQIHGVSMTGFVFAVLPVYWLVLLPGAGWLLLCSAAPRRPFFLAYIVPGAFWLLDKMGLSNPIFKMLIVNVVPTWLLSGPSVLFHGAFDVAHPPAIHLAPIYARLADTQTWVGVALGAIFIGLAVWQRRRNVAIG